MDSKLSLSALLVLFGLNSGAQLLELEQGQAAYPLGTEKLLGQRYKGLRSAGGSSEKEIFIGVQDLDVAYNRVEGDIIYGNTIHFRVIYDPIGDSLTTETTIARRSFRSSMKNISAVANAAGRVTPLSEMDFMEMEVRTQNATSALDVTNLTINGRTVYGTYNRYNSPGQSFWHIENFDFGSGFIMTGTITTTGNFGSNTDFNKVEFVFGSQRTIPRSSTYSTLQVDKAGTGDNVLSWTTQTDSNIDHFQIQRSTDSRNFSIIGSVSAIGSNTVTKYQFEDKGVSSEAYYRIIERRKDGSIAFSRIVNIEGLSAVSTVIYDGRNTLRVQLAGSEPRQVVIYDLGGRVMLRSQVSENGAFIHLDNLPLGIYMVKIEGERGAFRFLKN